jgi:hypothetical protein
MRVGVGQIRVALPVRASISISKIAER